MNKIMCLIPCLMLDNNRECNKSAINELLNKFNFDQVTIYDQMFEKSDFDPRCTYIGHAKERMGWVLPRNELLKYFYNSDFDYAFWIDANSRISIPTSNDLASLIEAIHNNQLDECDAIFSTLGIWVSTDRIAAKLADDYRENVCLIPRKYDKNYCWVHGMFMKNFKKYYNEEPDIDERSDTRKGTADDVLFSRLIRKMYSTWLCPTIVINKPSSKFSCNWSSPDGGYHYPKDDYVTIDSYVEDTIKRCNLKGNKINQTTIKVPRVEQYKELIKDYQPKTKKTSSNKVSLFDI